MLYSVIYHTIERMHKGIVDLSINLSVFLLPHVVLKQKFSQAIHQINKNIQCISPFKVLRWKFNLVHLSLGDQIIAPAVSKRSIHYGFLLLTVWSHRTESCHCLSPPPSRQSPLGHSGPWSLKNPSKSLHRCSAACPALIPITGDLWINMQKWQLPGVWLGFSLRHPSESACFYNKQNFLFPVGDSFAINWDYH